MSISTGDRRLSDSGVAWIGQIPDEWQVIPAKAVFKERKSASRLVDVHLTPSQQHGVLPQTEYMARTGTRVVLNLAGADAMRHVEPGDFISHLRSFQGGIEYSSFAGKVSAAYTVLQARRELHPGFFRHLLKSSRYVQALQTTTEQLRDGQSIRYVQFATLPLPFPPLGEQGAIAEFLDRETAEIDAFIRDQEELIGLLQERRAATISHAVTRGIRADALAFSGTDWLGNIPSSWKVMKVKHVCRIQTGSGDTQDAADQGRYPFYVRSETPLSTDTAEFSGPAVLTAGDGAGVGKVFHLAYGPFSAHQRVYVMTSFRQVSAEYFFWYFSSYFARVALEGTAKSTVDSVRRPMISDLPISVPSIAEQNQIVSFVTKRTRELDASIEDALEAIALSRERRSSLISAAVTGKIDVHEHVGV